MALLWGTMELLRYHLAKTWRKGTWSKSGSSVHRYGLICTALHNSSNRFQCPVAVRAWLGMMPDFTWSDVRRRSRWKAWLMVGATCDKVPYVDCGYVALQ
jgi:hypothetical protein